MVGCLAGFINAPNAAGVWEAVGTWAWWDGSRVGFQCWDCPDLGIWRLHPVNLLCGLCSPALSLAPVWHSRYGSVLVSGWGSPGFMVSPLSSGWCKHNLLSTCAAENKAQLSSEGIILHSCHGRASTAPQAWLLKWGCIANPVSQHHLEPQHCSLCPRTLSSVKIFMQLLNEVDSVA